jgi:PmbA protein
MAHCQRCGCSQVRVNVYSGTNTDFEVRDEALEKLQQSSENQLTLHLFVEGRYGVCSTNRMDKAELERFIVEAVESVRYLAPDPCRQLPRLDRCYAGGKPDLALYDAAIGTLSPDEKIHWTHAAAREILGTDERILSVQSAYSDGESFSYTVDSNGFEGLSNHSYYSLSVSVSIKGEGEARPESFWYDQALFWKDLQKEGIGRIALERTLQKLGQEKAASGTYTLLVDPMNVGRLLAPVLNALSGASLQQKNSFLLDKLGQAVFSPKMTLVDEPHVPGRFGARYFDNEGVATQPRTLIEKGVINTYLIDTYHALKMEVEPTISGVSHLIFTPGNRDLEAMITSVDKGILVTGFNGGNCNSSSGDFSFGVEGFLLEKGKRVRPVSEMNVTGNMLDLWNKLEEVGNDPRLNNAYWIPSLRFEGIDFSGY